MKRAIISVLTALFFGGVVSAEELSGNSFQNFSKEINSVKIIAAENIKLWKNIEIKPEKIIVKSDKSQYISVSAYVNLSGSGFLSSQGRASVSFTDRVVFRDSSGQIASSRVYINERVSFWARDNHHVSQNVYINENVQLYKNGKYIGSLYIRGTIRVSGWPSSNHIRLSGSGYLRGGFYLEETKK